MEAGRWGIKCGRPGGARAEAETIVGFGTQMLISASNGSRHVSRNGSSA